MALTVSTDLTNITDCETAYASPPWYAIGAQTPSIEPDFFAQGSNSFSRAVSGAVTKGMVYDLGATGLDFSATGGHYNKLIYIWLRSNTPSLMATLANGGLIVRIGSGTPPSTDYKDYYVGGNDFLQVSSTTGWMMAVIDPRAPASASAGTFNIANIRYFGGAMTTTTTAKGQNFGIDRISYGRGILRARGTPDSTGGGIREMLNWDWGTLTNRWGILTERAGIIYCKGKLSIGDAASTNPTNFSTENDVVVWEPTWYRDSNGIIRPTVGYDTSGNWNDGRDSSGTPYYGIEFVGNTTTPAGDTTVQFGQKVGTGDTASGRNGPLLVGSSQLPTVLSGDDGNVETAKVYGTTFQNFRYLDFSTNAAADEFIGNTLITCGTTRPSTSAQMILRNDTFIDGLGGAYRFFERFLNPEASASEALATADPITDWSNVLNGTNLAVPSSSAGYVQLLAAATQRNVVQVNADVVGADDHYVDAIIRFPTGTSQGTIGVTIRGATGTTENYYFLQLDRPNNQVALIRCDAGTDTTIAGPTAMTLNADTDHLVYIRGSGTTIEGFVSASGTTTKLSATGQSSYQTNRRVGIRGTTNGSQSANAQPRVSRFGAGPYTDQLGSVKFPATTNNNTQYCTFINNARATTISNAETFSFTEHTFSGNIVGLRNQSGGAVIVNATKGSPEASRENEGAGTITVNNTKTLSIKVVDINNNPIQNVQAAIYQSSNDVELMNEDTIADGTATADFNYTEDTPIYYRVRRSSVATGTKYIPVSGSGTIISSGFSVTITMFIDPNA